MLQFIKQFRWRHFVNIIALIVIGFIAAQTIHVISRNYQLQQEVDNLREEISLLELQNQELEYQIAYYQTDAFADREARDKLGLQAPGETVVIFPDKVPGNAEIKHGTTTEELPQPDVSNFEQWMYFLFDVEPTG